MHSVLGNIAKVRMIVKGKLVCRQARKKKKDIKPWDIVERAGSPVEL